MSTPQGNFVAYQQLKPTELKVGDYYKSYIDDLIKRGETAKATQAKLLQEKQKHIWDRLKDIKIDPTSTTANLSGFMSNHFRDTANFIGTMRMQAEKDPENAHIFIARAERAANDYKAMASVFGSKDFIEKANAKQQALANHDVFTDSDSNEQLSMLAYQIPIYRRNSDTGGVDFYLPRSGKAQDEDSLQRFSVEELATLYTTPDEINLLRSNKSNGNNGFLDKQIFDIADQMSDEYERNVDGNRTTGKEWFARDRGNQWFNTHFGEYNPNYISPIVRQYAKIVLGKSISGENAETVFEETKQSIIDAVGSLVSRKEKVDTKYTAAQLEGQLLENKEKRLRIARLKQDLANPNRRGGGDSNKVAISNVDGGIYRLWENGKTNEYKNGTLINLDNKEYLFGIKVPNSNGRGYHTEYAILGKDDKGRLGFEKMTSRGDVAIRLRGYNYDPNMVESLILSGAPVKIGAPQKSGLSGKLKYREQGEEIEGDKGFTPITSPYEEILRKLN